MKLHKAVPILICAVGLVGLFQNCGNALNFGGSKKQESASRMAGGDSFSGKTGYYLGFDPGNPCARVSNMGNPFPNRQIFFTGGVASLVRDNCSNIEPVILAPNTYTLNSDNTLTYEGRKFDLYPNLREFDQIPRMCPSGNPPASFAVDGSLFPDSLHLPSWLISPGVEVPLYGAIEALPRYQILHTVNNQDFRRVTSRIAFQPNTDYAFSVWMAPGSQNEAVIYFHVDDDNDWGWSFNLGNGSHGLIHQSNFPPANLRATMQPYSSGYVVTVFFRTPATLPADSFGDLGPGPQGSTAPASLMEIQAGSYIYATGADLRAVSSYCP